MFFRPPTLHLRFSPQSGLPESAAASRLATPPLNSLTLSAAAPTHIGGARARLATIPGRRPSAAPAHDLDASLDDVAAVAAGIGAARGVARIIAVRAPVRLGAVSAGGADDAASLNAALHVESTVARGIPQGGMVAHVDQDRFFILDSFVHTDHPRGRIPSASSRLAADGSRHPELPSFRLKNTIGRRLSTTVTHPLPSSSCFQRCRKPLFDACFGK